MLKKVPDPERFGVPVFEGKRIVKIEEKPKLAGSPFAIIGVYFYDGTVFDRMRPLRPAGRAELAITDVNNSYLPCESLWWATKMMREKALLLQGNLAVSDRPFGLRLRVKETRCAR